MTYPSSKQFETIVNTNNHQHQQCRRMTSKKGHWRNESFNALSKQITNAIGQKNTIEMLKTRFDELRDVRKQLKELHNNYIVISITDTEDESLDDIYLDTLEEEYRITEQYVHEYTAEIANNRDKQIDEDKRTSDKSKHEGGNCKLT